MNLFYFNPECNGACPFAPFDKDAFSGWLKGNTLVVRKGGNTLYLIRRDRLTGKRLTVPLLDKNIHGITILRRCRCFVSIAYVAPLTKHGIWLCAIDRFAILLKPPANGEKYLLLIFRNGAIATGRDVKAEVASTSHIVLL